MHRPLLHPAHHLEIMRDDDHRRALLMDGFQKLHNGDGIFVIQVAGRLIRNQDLRLVDQRPGDRRPLLLTAAQLPRKGSSLLTETDLFQHFRHILPDIRRGTPGDQLRKGHILIDRTILQQTKILKYDAETAAVFRHMPALHMLQVHIIDDDLPLRRLQLLRQKPHQRRFSGAATPDDEAELSIADGEIDISKCLHAVFIGLGNIFDFDHSLHFSCIMWKGRSPHSQGPAVSVLFRILQRPAASLPGHPINNQWSPYTSYTLQPSARS